MKKPTTISKESVSEYREFVQLRLRKRVLEAIEVVLEEEVDQALGCRSYERAEDRRAQRSRNPSRDDVGGNSRAPGATSPVRDEEPREKRQSSGASCCPGMHAGLVRSTRRSWGPTCRARIAAGSAKR